MAGATTAAGTPTQAGHGAADEGFALKTMPVHQWVTNYSDSNKLVVNTDIEFTINPEKRQVVGLRRASDESFSFLSSPDGNGATMRDELIRSLNTKIAEIYGSQILTVTEVRIFRGVLSADFENAEGKFTATLDSTIRGDNPRAGRPTHVTPRV